MVVVSESSDEDEDSNFTAEENNVFSGLSQAIVKNLARDLNLSQRKRESLGSRPKQYYAVTDDFRVTRHRNRRNFSAFEECFSENHTTEIVYCNDSHRLFERIGLIYAPEDWRMFIDSSKKSLKVVLLHNGNKFPSVPIAYSRNTKETYEKLNQILKLLQYNQHKWKICSDLKVVGLLMGLRKGFCKNQCFLCEWEGRIKDLHYTDYQWKRRTSYNKGDPCIDLQALVSASVIILPPLQKNWGW